MVTATLDPASVQRDASVMNRRAVVEERGGNFISMQVATNTGSPASAILDPFGNLQFCGD